MQAYINANTTSLDFLLAALDDMSQEVYATTVKPGFQSPIAAHYRHIIEHYQCLFRQLAAGQVVNYDLRARDMALESDKAYCRQQLLELKSSLAEIDCTQEGQELVIKDDHSDQAMHSSLCRELMFLIGHTEHHSAMIAAMLRILGYRVDQQFGVANATLNYQSTIGKRA